MRPAPFCLRGYNAAVFAVSTSFRDFTRVDSPPSIDAFAREIRDLGAAGVTIESGVPEARLREMLEIFSGAGCPVLAIDAPNPRPATFDRNLEAFARVSASDADREGRAIAERLWRRTMEIAADARIPEVVVRLGRVERAPDVEGIEAILSDEPLGTRKTDAYVRDAMAARAQRAAPHFDAARRTLGAVLPVAERLGLTVSVVAPGALDSIPSFRELELLQGEFEGAPLGVWLDTGAMFEIEALRLKAAAAWVERFGPLLRGANLRDAKTAPEGITRDLRPGDGEVDFAALKTALGDRFSRLVLAYTVPEDDPGLARESISHLRRGGWL